MAKSLRSGQTCGSRFAAGASRPHRWVTDEPDIPFELGVLYEDARIIVVDKPHFLATTPRGMWYRQSALIRLRERFGEPDITPAHRLDRATAGVVVFVRSKAARGAYQMLFQERRARKVYECLAPVRPVSSSFTDDSPVPPIAAARASAFAVVDDSPSPAAPAFPLTRATRIVKERGRLQAYEEPGEPNAVTGIERADVLVPPDVSSAERGAGERGVARYVLRPHTGKTHQLRVHMNALGLPIIGDDLYPRIVERPYDDFSHPLQLVARVLEFDDPFTGEPRRFVSRVALGV